MPGRVSSAASGAKHFRDDTPQCRRDSRVHAVEVLLDWRLGRQFTQALPRWHPQRR